MTKKKAGSGVATCDPHDYRFAIVAEAIRASIEYAFLNLGGLRVRRVPYSQPKYTPVAHVFDLNDTGKRWLHTWFHIFSSKYIVFHAIMLLSHAQIFIVLGIQLFCFFMVFN